MERSAIRIYWFASCVAVLEASLLFSLGLELSAEQVKLLILFGFPAPIIMYINDRWLITRHTRGIDTVCEALDAGQTVAPDDMRRAYYQTLNLPMLTLLRVLTIHAPSVLIPITLLGLLANYTTNLGLTWWQFFVGWSL